MTSWNETFSRKAFAAPSAVRYIGKWRVEFLGFTSPAKDRTALLCLGGAFQSRWSFRHVAEHLHPHMPVVVVDLPGQGNNAQEADELNFDDFAGILDALCEAEGLHRVVALGLSYGSAIAHAFACRYPQRVEKLILGGTSARLRDSIVATLRHSLGLIGENEREAFATGAILHLLNHSKRDRTGISDRLIQRMYESIFELDEPARRRYRANTERLIGYRMTQAPHVPTLVYVGEFDSFTSPRESWEVSRMIPGARFALIADADHLVPLQRQKVELQLYHAFLLDQLPLEKVEGLKSLDRLPEERRVFERYEGGNTTIHVRYLEHGGRGFDVRLQDGSAAGFSFETPEGTTSGARIEVDVGSDTLLAHAYETGKCTRAAVIMTSMPAQHHWESRISGLPVSMMDRRTGQRVA
ncbi:MAG: alpha/beta fold hydrolase [Burkholderiales bacterium]